MNSHSFNKTELGYVGSNSSLPSASKSTRLRVRFVPQYEKVEPKVEQPKADKGKCIISNAQKTTPRRPSNKNNQLKRPYFCHHCGAAGHTTHSNCFKWVAS